MRTSTNKETWRNKGFLLLVSTYIGLNDLFQARATAESILANVQAPDVQEAVSDLLFEIDALEAAQNAPDANTGDETPTKNPNPTTNDPQPNTLASGWRPQASSWQVRMHMAKRTPWRWTSPLSAAVKWRCVMQSS